MVDCMEFLAGKELFELEELIEIFGEKRYRAKQIYEWIYVHNVDDFSSMSNISKSFREKLKGEFSLYSIKLENINKSRDGSKKFLFKLWDGNFIESVYIPEREWSTICISSQVGCAMGCKFCATGKMGFVRNLSAGEIVEQLIHVIKSENLKKKRVNVVYMGMGEPLLNFDNVIKSYNLITDPDGMSISRRRVTISTCGILDGLEKIRALEKIPKLAISLNATKDEIRNELMPINKKYSFKDVLNFCDKLPLKKGERITIEYVMLKDKNDSMEDAKRLSKLLKPFRTKINLIPYNPIDDVYDSSPMDRIFKFQEFLKERRFTVTIRDSKGKDISGACGMLALKSI